jgi:hypothetical protein
VNPLLIAAAKFEIEPLLNALQQIGHTPDYILTGVGAINAAKRARSIAETARGRSVIFVGTCGSFSPFSKVYLVRASEVHWSPTCERLRLSYTVKDSAPPIILPEPPAYLRNLPSRKVLCSPSISLVSKLPDGFSAEQSVENIELYSCIGEVSSQCANLSVVLAVTNAVGPDSHAEWRQNFTIAAGRTAEFIASKFGNLSNS